MYQAAHPELPNLRFSSDFRAAFPMRDPSVVAVVVVEAVELSVEERQKAESLHREMLEARQAFEQAQKNWRDYQYELVADHVPATGTGLPVTLQSGKGAVIPNPWGFGMAFTPDFRVAVPR